VPVADNQAWLRCADRFDVRLSCDSHRESITMQAIIGKLSPPEDFADTPAGHARAGWTTVDSVGDDTKHDALLWHQGTGGVAARSTAPARQLDAVSFAFWVADFIDRLIRVESVLSKRSPPASSAPCPVGPLELEAFFNQESPREEP
jgi:hypothetical protein